MKEQPRIDASSLLRTVIEQLGRLEIEVRQEHLGGESGGLCTLRGRRVVFVDLDADAVTRLERCVKVLRGLPELETVYLPPKLRELLDRGES